MVRYLAFDVGATNTRAAVVDADGTVLARRDRRTPAVGDGRRIAEAVREAGLEACREAAVDAADVERAAVATVAEIDRDRGGVVDPANFSDDVDFLPLVDALSPLVDGEEVLLCNDATAGALGERETRPAGASRRDARRPEGSREPGGASPSDSEGRSGASPSSTDGSPDDLVYLTMSTGIGAGVIADGRVLEGHRGNAGEVGHVTLDPEGRLRCACGGDGHWEAYCSGGGVPRYARHLADAEEVDTDLPLEEIDAADVFDAAGDDPLADRVVERLADWNAQGVAAVVHAYAPAVVAIGGAVALENPELVVAPIRERLPEYVHVGPVPEVRLTRAGADVVLAGAIHRAIEGPSRGPV